MWPPMKAFLYGMDGAGSSFLALSICADAAGCLLNAAAWFLLWRWALPFATGLLARLPVDFFVALLYGMDGAGRSFMALSGCADAAGCLLNAVN